jgi:transposase
LAETIVFLSKSVGKKNAQIGKLTNMLFGAVTEKTAKVLKEKKEKEKAGSEDKQIKGHGKNGASQYSGAKVIAIAHLTLKPKDKCPSCKKGKVYEANIPKTVVRITAQAPLTACLYQMQRLSVQPLWKNIYSGYSRRNR